MGLASPKLSVLLYWPVAPKAPAASAVDREVHRPAPNRKQDRVVSWAEYSSEQAGEFEQRS